MLSPEGPMCHTFSGKMSASFTKTGSQHGMSSSEHGARSSAGYINGHVVKINPKGRLGICG